MQEFLTQFFSLMCIISARDVTKTASRHSKHVIAFVELLKMFYWRLLYKQMLVRHFKQFLAINDGF